jgi:hypothetical protein
LNVGGVFRSVGCAVLVAGLVTATVACQSRRARRVPPQVLIGPYDTTSGEVLWGVVPLRNESGSSLVDTLQMSDQLVSAVEQVRGLRAVPLNRTIEAMRSLGLREVSSASDARQLASEMGVDGLLVGSVTAWDPYDPPTVGLSLALYARRGALGDDAAREVDPRQLIFQPTDFGKYDASTSADRPASVASQVLEGKNHQVLMDLDQYVAGRSDPTNVLGTHRYLANMELFTEFAAWRLVGELVQQEWMRLSRASIETGP